MEKNSSETNFNRIVEIIGIFDANTKIQQNNCNNEDKILNQNIKYIESRFQYKVFNIAQNNPKQNTSPMNSSKSDKYEKPCFCRDSYLELFL